MSNFYLLQPASDAEGVVTNATVVPAGALPQTISGLPSGVSYRVASLNYATGTYTTYTPASLFSASEPGFWADVSTSVLWQDVARTTPVTSAGQPVASWQLNTASGVIYATQPSASACPTYQVDGSGRPYLSFDGVNDCLIVPTITPGTDKAQIFAGVTKASDAAAAMVYELSSSWGVNNGAIAILAPSAGGAPRYTFVSKGTTSSTAAKDLFPAPTTNVVTGIGDIAADTCILRVNGVQQVSQSTDQGTGNYLAYQSFIGSRNNTGFRFNGSIYGLIVRFGPTLTSTEIGNAETWMNSKTGAY